MCFCCPSPSAGEALLAVLPGGGLLSETQPNFPSSGTLFFLLRLSLFLSAVIVPAWVFLPSRESRAFRFAFCRT